jgi:hypothetical protein
MGAFILRTILSTVTSRNVNGDNYKNKRISSYVILLILTSFKASSRVKCNLLSIKEVHREEESMRKTNLPLDELIAQ